MPKEKKKRSKRVKKLIIVCTLSAIILIVSTYAWFIGMQEVHVTPFDVEIKSTDSLMLSIDGDEWSDTININSTNYKTDAYTDNTNQWTELIPVSTIGEMDTTSSMMKLYEKASFKTTHGGYRLLASRINNYVIPTGSEDTKITEKTGYVAFDLFVKNFSGRQYIKDLDVKDEEDIFLTTDSEVKVATAGTPGTGIENSVRVAFAQIGRVVGTETTQGTITNITCSNTTDVTGICRTAQIWEPNDKEHVGGAISWYSTSCLKRTAEDITDTASYTDDSTCGTVEQGKTYDTYAVTKDITNANNVDIYDGFLYNAYTATTTMGSCTAGDVPTTEPECLSVYGVWDGTTCSGHYGTGDTTGGDKKAYCDAIGGTYTETPTAGGYLEAFPYFTDTMKMLTGVNRPTFMTLAPNSITKVRVYIYIEGQDIDNYDFASIGKRISVAFGLTKERFTEGDIGYTGPALSTESE